MRRAFDLPRDAANSCAQADWAEFVRRLILVRHAESAHNAAGLFVGRSDPPLSERGVAQAAALATGLTGLPVEHVYSSPLARALSTAQAISEATGAPITTDERLIELDYGDWEGRPVAELIASGEFHRATASTDFTPSRGESLSALDSRVRLLLGEIAQQEFSGNAVLVAHMGPVKVGVLWALGAGLEGFARLRVDAASVSRIMLTVRHPVLLTMNEVFDAEDNTTR